MRRKGLAGRHEQEQGWGRAHPSVQPWQHFTQLVNQGMGGETAACEADRDQKKMGWTGEREGQAGMLEVPLSERSREI